MSEDYENKLQQENCFHYISVRGIKETGTASKRYTWIWKNYCYWHKKAKMDHQRKLSSKFSARLIYKQLLPIEWLCVKSLIFMLNAYNHGRFSGELDSLIQDQDQPWQIHWANSSTFQLYSISEEEVPYLLLQNCCIVIKSPERMLPGQLQS